MIEAYVNSALRRDPAIRLLVLMMARERAWRRSVVREVYGR